MGIGKTWRQVKAWKAVGQAANEAAARNAPGSAPPPRGFAAAFANVLTDAMAPHIATLAERRGGPLPGSDAIIAAGSAWAQPLAAAAGQIRARDAAFDPALLEDFAGQVFAAVIAVWSGADSGSIRPVLADALWEPLAAATGTAKRPIDWTQHSLQQATAQLTGLHAGNWYDSAMVAMHVRLDFSREAPPPGMPDEMKQWDEDWLFQRSVQPGGDPMIRPPACPACGAPTHIDEAGACMHCRAPVPVLTTGWLAAGIFSRHPVHAMRRERLVQHVRENPGFLQQMPPEMRKLLPPDVADGLAGAPPGSPW